jgi:hypothetical protein
VSDIKTDEVQEPADVAGQREMPCYVVDFDVLLDEIHTATTGKQAVTFGTTGDAYVSKDMRDEAGLDPAAKTKQR